MKDKHVNYDKNYLYFFKTVEERKMLVVVSKKEKESPKIIQSHKDGKDI